MLSILADFNSRIFIFLAMQIIEQDSQLAPYANILQNRQKRLDSRLDEINKHFDSLLNFASWHKELGFHIEKGQLVYRDWIPQVQQVSLVGDFNSWNTDAHSMTRGNSDLWWIKISLKDFPEGSPHQQKIKLRIKTEKGDYIDRIPAMMQYCFQDPTSNAFYGS